MWASVAAACGFRSCSSWDLEYQLNCSRHMGFSGVKPMSPVLAGGFFTTEPQGKPLYVFINHWNLKNKTNEQI